MHYVMQKKKKKKKLFVAVLQVRYFFGWIRIRPFQISFKNI